MLSHHKQPFINNTSGKMVKKQEQGKYKQIDLGEYDVQMISPQFLQLKTLKKPLRQYEVTLNKTNPSGLQYHNIQHEPPFKDYPTTVIFKKDEPKVERKQHASLSIIDASALKITPAYKKDQSVGHNSYLANPVSFGFEKDSNTILAAILKKGLKPEVVAQPNILAPKEEKKVGPAEAKLRTLIAKKQPMKQSKSNFSSFKHKEEVKKSDPSQIGEQIGEDIDEYGYESFQKLSGAYQSAVRESIVGQSNIKESIRESIRQSLVGSSSRIRESIREQIRQSLNQSVRQMKQEIIEEISASAKRSKESIEEVYEEIFQDQNSNSMGKNQNKFKKSNVKQSESLSQSQSASKSFRMKTNVAKSMRLAEEAKRKQVSLAEDKLMNESLSKQKENLKKIRENIAKLLKKQKKNDVLVQKNKDLYYNFKVEINRLISSDNFESKLKKLSSFLSIGSEIVPNKDYVNQLQDNILKNVLMQIESIKMGRQQLDQIGKIKKEYEDKLQQELRIQSVNLRAEMNQKLSEKDLQLRKMIADLESRLMSRTVPGGYQSNVSSARVEQYEIESDYSIDSQNISWKADLWELLPQFEKKKLYEKQTAEVTKFLADVMINQLKEQALQRSIDISFEFPEGSDLQASIDANISSKLRQSNSESGSWQKQNVSKRGDDKKNQFLAELPKIGKKNISEESQSSREDSPLKFQRTRKDDKLKPQIIKILSDYKTIYLRKKQEVIRKLLKVVLSREINSQAYLYSSLQEVNILGERQYKKQHQLYIRAYEEELLWNLVGIYTRCLNKKQAVIEEEMKKMYDRLVVVCQVSTADKCTERIALDVQKTSNFNVQVLTREALRQMQAAPCAIEIVAHQNYMDLKSKKQQRLIQSELVEHIVNILSLQFSKQFPTRKK